MYAQVHAKRIQPVENKKRTDTAVIYREWDRKVYGAIQGAIRRKVDGRPQREGEKERQRAMEAYLQASSAGQAVLLDQAGPGYDPWANREGPVLVRGTGKGGRIVDPTKRVFAAHSREQRLIKAGRSAAAFAKAFRTKMGETADGDELQEQGHSHEETGGVGARGGSTMQGGSGALGVTMGGLIGGTFAAGTGVTGGTTRGRGGRTAGASAPAGSRRAKRGVGFGESKTGSLGLSAGASTGQI